VLYGVVVDASCKVLSLYCSREVNLFLSTHEGVWGNKGIVPLNIGLDRGEWSASRSDRFTSST
jgi:hypothetical protein